MRMGTTVLIYIFVGFGKHIIMVLIGLQEELIMADPLYFYTDPIGTERIISFSASTKQVSHLNQTNQSKLSVRGI